MRRNQEKKHKKMKKKTQKDDYYNKCLCNCRFIDFNNTYLAFCIFRVMNQTLCPTPHTQKPPKFNSKPPPPQLYIYKQKTL